ncbi:MAG: L-threonylcarbamoyladenylate synthase [Hydrogenophilus sp.]|nr:L-threonylcarbamoyladenylate synthase [Hydrogenophilus sp.]
MRERGRRQSEEEQRGRVVAASPEMIGVAAAWLQEGKLVAIPTETVYGLAADAEQEEAVRRVFAVKGRPANHPLIVHVADEGMATAYAAEWPRAAAILTRRFWPGPLTVVVEASARVLPVVTGGQSRVALRVPRHQWTRQLIARLGRGVVAPSANRFGRISPTSAAHVAAEFAGVDLLVVDGGRTAIGVESTIVDCSQVEQEGCVRVLRLGAVGVKALRRALAEEGCTVRVEEGEREGEGERGKRSESVRVPGSLPAHYAPQTRLVLWEDAEESVPEGERRRGVWAPADWPRVPGEVVRFVQLEDGYSVARALYAVLRTMDGLGVEELVAALPRGEDPLSTAVRDRLRRAAAGSGGGTVLIALRRENEGPYSLRTEPDRDVACGGSTNGFV